MNDEKKQDNPIETLERIRNIVDTMDTLSLYCDELDPVYIHDQTAVLLGLLDSLLESAKATRQISSYGVSFWLKFCDPLPAVEESMLKDRGWQIDASEIDEMPRRVPPFDDKAWR